MIVLIMALVFGWIICAILAAGIQLAYLQHEFPESTLADYRTDYRTDFGSVLLLGLLLGPIALVIAFFTTGFAQYGYTLSPPKK